MIHKQRSKTKPKPNARATASRCKLPCAAPCERLPCNLPCSKLLVSCSHPCPSLCGETCPDSAVACSICAPAKDDVSQLADQLQQSSFSAASLTPASFIVLECGHRHNIKVLDQLMHMNAYYEIDSSGRCISVKPLPLPCLNRPICPDCHAPICNIKRYGRQLKHMNLERNEQNLVKEAQQHCQALSSSFAVIQEKATKVCPFWHSQSSCQYVVKLQQVVKGLLKSITLQHPRSACVPKAEMSTAPLPEPISAVAAPVADLLVKVIDLQIQSHVKYLSSVKSEGGEQRRSRVMARSSFAEAVTGLTESVGESAAAIELIISLLRSLPSRKTMTLVVSCLNPLQTGFRELKSIKSLPALPVSLKNHIADVMEQTAGFPQSISADLGNGGIASSADVITVVRQRVFLDGEPSTAASSQPHCQHLIGSSNL